MRRRVNIIDVTPHEKGYSVEVVAPAGSGPCLKQVVVATVVCPDGSRYRATNHRLSLVPECPRAGMPTGKGYDLCRDVCRQPAHAEVNALALAGDAARGGKLYLDGHSYACDSCLDAARRAGIVEVEVGASVFRLQEATWHTR